MKDLFGKEEIRALWWKQPYGSLMLPPFDKVETRTWGTQYRGLVLICTSLQPYKEKFIDNISGEWYREHIKDLLKDEPTREVYGHAIGIGRLVESRMMKFGDGKRAYVQYNHFLYIHRYIEVKRIEPFPLKGSQGWRKVDAETRAKIRLIA